MAPDPTLPPSVPPQHIEACLGFGCGQCKKRTFGPNAVLPYQAPGKTEVGSGLVFGRHRSGADTGVVKKVTARGVAVALIRRLLALLVLAAIIMICADRCLARNRRRAARTLNPRSKLQREEGKSVLVAERGVLGHTGHCGHAPPFSN